MKSDIASGQGYAADEWPPREDTLLTLSLAWPVHKHDLLSTYQELTGSSRNPLSRLRAQIPS